MSIKEAGAVKSIHFPRSGIESILRRIINESKPITAVEKLAARDKKLWSFMIFFR